MSEPDPRTARATATATVDPLMGRVVSDRYRVVRKLGGHGQGQDHAHHDGGHDVAGGVYLADHLLANRKVVLKVVLPDGGAPELVDTFLEEARIVARVGHENVVEIFSGGRAHEGFVFLATEYLEGRDLAQLLREEAKPLPWERARAILLQIAAGLGAVHHHGVVHRDLQPRNVFLVKRDGHAGQTAQGQAQGDLVKVFDFGVARLMSGAGIHDTDQGRITGTPEYMAPEQAQAGKIDQHADVYSLGCIAYELMTGEPPFRGDSILQVLAKHVNEAPLPPSLKRPDLPISPDMDALVLRALEKDPERRWPDMATFAEALDKAREKTARDGRRSSIRYEMPPPEVLQAADQVSRAAAEARAGVDKRRRRRRRVLGVLAVEAVVVGALLVWRAFTGAPGHVTVSVDPVDAVVALDDVPVGAGAGPHAPLTFDARPGRHAISVSRTGYVTAHHQIDVDPRGSVTVPVKLEPVPGPSAAREAPPAP